MNCPRCQKPGQPSGDKQFYCRNCRVTYEPDIEGIDPTARYNPERRMLHEEEQRERKPKHPRRR